MGKNPQISATLPAHVNDAISRRAKQVGGSKSDYLSAIATWWFGQGCPPVRPDEEQLRRRDKQIEAEADRLMTEFQKRVKPVPEDLDPWHLNPDQVYMVMKDEVVRSLLAQLGVPNAFAEAREHDHIHAVEPYDNHPTHWIIVHLYKGYGGKDDGLLFHAVPKSDVTRAEIIAGLQREDGRTPPLEIKFSQLPPRTIDPLISPKPASPQEVGS